MHFHERTAHTYDSVRMPRFLDWDTQPSSFKRYPSFFLRYPFDSLPERDFWPLLGSITAHRENADSRYALRTIPSGGALFPVELYLQIRDKKEIPDGVYHYESASDSLTFLHQVGPDGVEPWLGIKKFNGIIFLISSPWFRTAWKYGARSFRYCNLDSGHQLGAIEAACSLKNRPFAFMTNFDKTGLAHRFGMEDKEFFMAAAFSGEEGDIEVRPLLLQLPHVLPTDYHEPMSKMIRAYKETLQEDQINMITIESPYNNEHLEDAVFNRRSIRAFRRIPMNFDELSQILEVMTNTLLQKNLEINVYTVIHSTMDNKEPGLYKNGEFIKAGNFSKKTGHLCLEQKLGSDGGATVFLTGKDEDYQALMIQAGLMGHRFYLESTRLKLGVSGIGAFYDEEVQKFLGTDDWVLYALAVGR